MNNRFGNLLDWIRETLGPPLRSAHASLDGWIDSLPDETGRFCAIGLFALAGLWVWTLKRDYIYLGAPDQALWRDLRIWAVLALLPYIFVYWWL